MTPDLLAARIRTLARETGFDLVGIASAAAPPELLAFARWAASGFAGEMAYLTGQVERRSDLRAALPWARSVVCLGLQYDSPHPYSTQAGETAGWISRYAWGEDYHDVAGEMLRRLQSAIEREAGPFRARAYADTGPVVERAYAAAAGVGAWGKNACLLHPEHGSWFFLAELVTDLELPADEPRPDMCGSCTACLEACPTGALREPYVLDATRCISYLTIEIKGAIPEELREGVGRHVFGCDICQDVCPWNRRRRHAGGPEFAPREGLMAPDLAELAALVLDEEAFRQRFRGSAVKRTRRRGLLRNLAVALGNSAHPQRERILARLAADEDPLVREHARWALGRTGTGT